MAAWDDAEIQRWTGVPEQRDLGAAERWISGDVARRQSGCSVDLVIDRTGSVVGEVGLSGFDWAGGQAEIGWWTAPGSRGDGVASTAARLVLEWALGPLGMGVVTARCVIENPASVAVARRAGLAVGRQGEDGVLLLVARR